MQSTGTKNVNNGGMHIPLESRVAESLFDRIVKAGNDKIGIHALVAAMREVYRGNLTTANLISEFTLDATQATQLNYMYAAITGSGDPVEIADRFTEVKDWFYLGEVGTKEADRYDKQAEFISRIDTF